MRASPGGRGTQQIFIWGGTAPRSNTLSCYKPFFMEKEKAPLLYTFYNQMVPGPFTYLI